jgi:hypothetical protein
MPMTMEELAHTQAFPVGNRTNGMTYGQWLVGQVLPKTVETMGKDADPKTIAARTLIIVNEMLTRMTSE